MVEVMMEGMGAMVLMMIQLRRGSFVRPTI